MTTLAEFEDFTTPKMRKRVVDSVFGSWDTLSKEARDSIKEAVGPLDGFRPGKDVPAGPLKAECHKLAKKFPDFFSQVMMPVWAKANPELLDLTANHMRQSPPPSDPNGKALDEYSTEQAETLASRNDGYPVEDLLVMVRYCATDTDLSLFSETAPDDIDSPYASLPGIGMVQFLTWLSSLPPDADEWRDLVPHFASDLADLISSKEAERSDLAAFASILTDIQAAHSETLGFFQADTSAWSDSKVAWVESKDTLRQQANSLTQALEEYAAASRSGSNLAEERKLREQRENLERAVESRINRINELLQDAERPDAHFQWVSLQDFIEGLEKIAAGTTFDEFASDDEPAPEDLLQSVETHAEEKRALEGRISGLEEENRDLEDEVRRLQQQVTLWRSNYETERRGKDDSEPDPIPTQFASVAHVLEVAEARFAGRLLFKFNSASDRGSAYDAPDDVWNAIEWLATTYYDSRTGRVSVPNLGDSLREVSRFRYTPHQSDNTMGMYPDSYYTRVDGIKVPLKEHMGAGVDRKPNNTIRIAFNWDKSSGKVIVGYVGLHQHNRKT